MQVRVEEIALFHRSNGCKHARWELSHVGDGIDKKARILDSYPLKECAFDWFKRVAEATKAAN